MFGLFASKDNIAKVMEETAANVFNNLFSYDSYLQSEKYKIFMFEIQDQKSI